MQKQRNLQNTGTSPAKAVLIKPSTKRGSHLFDPAELEKIRPISLHFKPKTRTHTLPKRSRTVLPTTNQRSLKNLRKMNVLLTFFLSLLIVIGCIYECQAIVDSNYEITEASNTLRLVLAILAFLQILLVFFYFWVVLRVKKSYKMISKHSTFFQDKDILLKSLVEVLISMIIAPPFMTYKFTIYQLSIKQTISLEHVLLGLVFLKTIHLHKLYYEFSYFNSLKSKFYCDLQKVDDPFKFTMRSFLKDMPFVSVLIMFTLCTLFYGVLLHFYEQNVEDSPFVSIWDCFWLVSYTQSTIGYGEITPKTHLGRLAIILSSFIGLFLYSYITLIVRNSTYLNDREVKLHFAIKHKKVGVKKLEKLASVLLQQWWALTLKRKARKSKISDVFQFNSILAEFSLERMKAEQDINPTLNEEIKKISKVPVKKLENLCRSLDSVFASEKIAHLCATKVYGIKRKVHKLNKRLRITCGIATFESSQLVAKQKFVTVKNEMSKVLLKKLRGEAVKKMMKNRIEKNTVNMTHGSVSSDEDFYSNWS